MRFFFTTLILLVVSMCTWSCGSLHRKIALPEVHTEVREIVKETVRDSIVQIPADSAWLKAFLACDSLGNVYLNAIEEHKGENIQIASPEIRYNAMKISATIDSSQIYLQWKERHSTRDSMRVVVQPPLEVNRVTGWQWFQIWLGRISAASLGVVLMLKMRRKF